LKLYQTADISSVVLLIWISPEPLSGSPDTAKERGKTSRALAILRVHGLIRKFPRSRRNLVSDKGLRVMSALIETKRKVYPEFAAV
jgi:hypothetical protein